MDDGIASIIITQIEKGVDDWIMPWHNGLKEAINPKTGQPYHGQNLWILWEEAIKRNTSSMEWATLHQWSSLGGKLRKGCKGTRVYKPKFRGTRGERAPSSYRHYTVFNYDDVNGIDRAHPDLFETSTTHAPMLENFLAEHMALASNADIRHGYDQAAYYRADDHIEMPSKVSFDPTAFCTASENYYATLIHELIHWTGHRSRCYRKPQFECPRESYAFEELVAEIGTALLLTRIEKRPVPRLDHAAYVKSWLFALNEDISYIYSATTAAQQAADYLCDLANISLQGHVWKLNSTHTSERTETNSNQNLTLANS